MKAGGLSNGKILGRGAPCGLSLRAGRYGVLPGVPPPAGGAFRPGLRLTLNTLLLKAVAEGLKAAPLLEILPPQVFAVGISALQEKPGVYTDQRGEKAIGVRRYLPMCLAFDHRVMDFSGLVPFLKRMDEIFASPAEIGTW